MKSKSLDEESDGQLIRRFAEGRDERAFAKLVERRGALVAGVCARMLRNRADAEDAFQAVFLVLARRAGALRRQISLGGWLHGVAVRVCLNERKIDRRRKHRVQELAAKAKETNKPQRLDELKQVIDEELSGLPARLREVLVLCDLEGRTRDEVARALAVPLGTVSSRLSRGRELMRKRLVHHGLQIAAGGVAFTFAECARAAPAMSAELVNTTIRNANIFLSGTAAAKSSLGLKISSLAEGAVHAMILHQWKTAACLVALLATTLFGGTIAPAFIASASAGTFFYDDFEDGSATDGTPVLWAPVPAYPTGSRTVENGRFVLEPDDVGYHAESDTEVEGVIHGDVSLRTQVQCEAGGWAFLFARSTFVNLDDDTNYQVWGAIRQRDGLIAIAYSNKNGATILNSLDTAWDVSSQAVNLQLDVLGDSLAMTAWVDGESKPVTPQLEANIANTTDVLGNRYTEGTIGLFVLTEPTYSQTARHYFEYFEAARDPEPSEGDTDSDGRVDLEDLNAVRNHFGEGVLGGPRIAGDAYPFDGIVDLGDLNLVRNHFGGDGAAAPEPATAALGATSGGLLGGLLLFGRRWRRGSWC